MSGTVVSANAHRSSQGSVLTKLLTEYQKKLTSIRDEAIQLRTEWVQKRTRHTEAAHQQAEDLQKKFGTLEPAARKLIGHSSQWLDHSTPRGSAEELELSVRLAEFEPLLFAAEDAVNRTVKS